MATTPMDFTTDPVPPISFKVDDDIFYAAGEAPGGTVTDLALASRGVGDDEDDDGEQLQVAMSFFDQVLLPESADLFARRLRDPEQPISLQKAMKIFAWLMGRYTDFPTQEPSSSPTGSKPTAKSSVARSSSRQATTRSVAKAASGAV